MGIAENECELAVEFVCGLRDERCRTRVNARSIFYDQRFFNHIVIL